MKVIMSTMKIMLTTSRVKEGDPRADFAALAVSYGTIDVRHNPNSDTDESFNYPTTCNTL